MTRDMSYRQFREACDRAGFKSEGALCYYRLAPPVDEYSVCILNAGDRRRDRLAYLHAQQEKHERAKAEELRTIRHAAADADTHSSDVDPGRGSW